MNTFKKVDNTKAESQNTETSMEVVEFSLVELFKRWDSPCLGWFRYMLTPLFKIEWARKPPEVSSSPTIPWIYWDKLKKEKESHATRN